MVIARGTARRDASPSQKPCASASCSRYQKKLPCPYQRPPRGTDRRVVADGVGRTDHLGTHDVVSETEQAGDERPITSHDLRTRASGSDGGASRRSRPSLRWHDHRVLTICASSGPDLGAESLGGRSSGCPRGRPATSKMHAFTARGVHPDLEHGPRERQFRILVGSSFTARTVCGPRRRAGIRVRVVASTSA